MAPAQKADLPNDPNASQGKRNRQLGPQHVAFRPVFHIKLLGPAHLCAGERQFFDAASVQAQLSEYVSALLEADAEAEPVPLDSALIAKVRLALAGLLLSQRIYNRVKRLVEQQQLPELSVTSAVGRDAAGRVQRDHPGRCPDLGYRPRL